NLGLPSGFPPANSFPPPAGVFGPQSPRPGPTFFGPTNFPPPGGNLPPGIGPQAGPANAPSFGAGASMPMMMPSMAPQEKVELIASTNKTVILGYPCTRYDATNRAERFE